MCVTLNIDPVFVQFGRLFSAMESMVSMCDVWINHVIDSLNWWQSSFE